MTRDEIETKIKSILVDDFDINPDVIEPKASFRGDMHLDSLDVVDFVMLLQKDLGFKSPMDSYRELHTFGHLVDFVTRTLAEHAKDSAG